MTAISRGQVSIYIANADTNPNTLVASDIIAGEIKSYSKSGGAQEAETDPVFGGFVTRDKPAEMVEIGLDVVPRVDSNQLYWDQLIYTRDSVNTTIFTMGLSGTVPSDKMVVIQAKSGSNYKTYAFNNCNVTVYDFEHSADDNRTGKMTLKFAPQTEAGRSNFMAATVAATALPAFSTLGTTV